MKLLWNRRKQRTGEPSMATHSAERQPPADAKPKYEHPKTMLIDCPSGMAKDLGRLGYSVTTGSFGKRYPVANDGGFRPALPVGLSLTGLPEQEVIVVDLTDPPIGEPADFASVGIGQPELWVKCSESTLDPRPRFMATYRDFFNRILRHGGQFVIFAATRSPQVYIPGNVEFRGGSLHRTDDPLVLDNWGFLSALSDDKVAVTFDRGTEMSTIERGDIE